MDRPMRGVPLANAPRVRHLRAADQGPLDWMVPFIPPVLRVNRETRAEIRRKVAQMLSKEMLTSLVLALRPHWRSLAGYAVAISIWIRGLVYVHEHAAEFAGAYVIFCGFAALGYHLVFGREGHAGGMSAYSVFNRGTQRMLGSLSAEQFENEIRHRPVGHEELQPQRGAGAARDVEDQEEVYDEDDPDLIAALNLSLQEKKRTERRTRRTSRRKC
uniref:SAYSvFN domain-containing protein n=1 Tax=Hyaloperonospora arabidopsidis (strain Emoy2) TaxID=559515 RepID=M4BB17_HYAAE